MGSAHHTLPTSGSLFNVSYLKINKNVVCPIAQTFFILLMSILAISFPMGDITTVVVFFNGNVAPVF